MRKYFFVLSFIFCFVHFIFSQGEGVGSFDDVFNSLTMHKVTQGVFSQQKFAAKLKKPLLSNGNFIFCDQGVVWQTLKPFPSVMAVTKTSIIQTKPNGSKSVIDGSSNAVFKSIAQAISSLFAGDKTALESFFNVKTFDASLSSWQMILEPKDSTIKAVLNTIELGGKIKDKNCSIDDMKIFQSASEYVIYSFSNQEYSSVLTDEQSAFFK